jgi:hypothetical protein
MIGAGFQVNDVAVTIGRVEKRGDRVGTQLWQDPENWVAPGSGGIVGSNTTACCDHVRTIIGAGLRVTVIMSPQADTPRSKELANAVA